MKSKLKAAMILGGIVMFSIASQAGFIIGPEDEPIGVVTHFVSLAHLLF